MSNKSIGINRKIYLYIAAAMMSIFTFPIQGCEKAAEIKSAINAANASAMSIHGRHLYVNMTFVNENRATAKMRDAWPRAQSLEPSAGDDVLCKNFSNATDYFSTLYGAMIGGKFGDSPNNLAKLGVRKEEIFDKKTGKSKWSVVKGDVNKLPDNVPVFVSDNVDVTSLISKKGIYPEKSLTGKLKFTGECAVVVTKMGSAHIIQKKYSKLRIVYGVCDEGEIVIPEDIEYLVP